MQKGCGGSDYTGIEISLPSIDLDKTLDDTLQSFREQMIDFSPVERPAALNDLVVLEAIPAGSAEDEEPRSIPNFGEPGKGVRLRAGMVMALEPMVNLGDWRTEVLSDGWTVVTADRKASAHFEHTIALADDGAQILTL